jgi:hypothetical protein
MKATSNPQILERVKLLAQYFADGKIERLAQHEVNPGLDKGDRLNYLYFTLPVSINFQRNSPALWQAALKTYQDPQTNYLFLPEQVVTKERSQVQQDLLKHRLGLQPNKHTDIWLKIATTLHEQYQDDPRQIIRAGQSCVVRIKNILQDTNSASFPYLKGNKMANYWLYILHNFTDVKLRNLHKISIIPDTHVLQSTVMLGLSSEIVTPEQAAELWEELLAGSGIMPIDIHPVLWNWSRAKFQPAIL